MSLRTKLEVSLTEMPLQFQQTILMAFMMKIIGKITNKRSLGIQRVEIVAKNQKESGLRLPSPPVSTLPFLRKGRVSCVPL